jgi:hypothetical protein
MPSASWSIIDHLKILRTQFCQCTLADTGYCHHLPTSWCHSLHALPAHTCTALRRCDVITPHLSLNKSRIHAMPFAHFVYPSELNVATKHLCYHLPCTSDPHHSLPTLWSLPFPLLQPVGHYPIPRKFQLVHGSFRIRQVFEQVPRFHDRVSQWF